MVGLAFNRGGKDFDERDRLLLDLLHPHLTQAFRNAEAFTRLHGQLAALQQLVDGQHQAALEVDQKGKILWATPAAWRLLQSYCSRTALIDVLPATLRQWIEQQKAWLHDATHVPPAIAPYVIEKDGGRLVVRLIPCADRSLLVVEEQSEQAAIQILEQLGLHRREAQVLFWVTEGKSNPEIGMILSISPRTVQKHLERIFEKLGVENRTAATARAFDALGRTTAWHV